MLFAALYELPNTDRGGGPDGVVEAWVMYEGGGPAGVVDGWEKSERFLRLGVLGESFEPGRRNDMFAPHNSDRLDPALRQLCAQVDVLEFGDPKD